MACWLWTAVMLWTRGSAYKAFNEASSTSQLRLLRSTGTGTSTAAQLTVLADAADARLSCCELLLASMAFMVG